MRRFERPLWFCSKGSHRRHSGCAVVSISDVRARERERERENIQQIAHNLTLKTTEKGK